MEICLINLQHFVFPVFESQVLHLQAGRAGGQQAVSRFYCSRRPQQAEDWTRPELAGFQLEYIYLQTKTKKRRIVALGLLGVMEARLCQRRPGGHFNDHEDVF